MDFSKTKLAVSYLNGVCFGIQMLSKQIREGEAVNVEAQFLKQALIIGKVCSRVVVGDYSGHEDLVNRVNELDIPCIDDIDNEIERNANNVSELPEVAKFAQKLFSEMIGISEEDLCRIVEHCPSKNVCKAANFTHNYAELINYKLNKIMEKYNLMYKGKFEINYGYILNVYNFWQDIQRKSRHYKNILYNVRENDFIKMVEEEDFTQINRSGNSQRVRGLIFFMSKTLGKEWGENTAKSINSTLNDCAKRISGDEIKALFEIK